MLLLSLKLISQVSLEESTTPQVAPDIITNDNEEETCITATMEAEEKKIHQQLMKQDKKEQTQVKLLTKD